MTHDQRPTPGRSTQSINGNNKNKNGNGHANRNRNRNQTNRKNDTKESSTKTTMTMMMMMNNTAVFPMRPMLGLAITVVGLCLLSLVSPTSALETNEINVFVMTDVHSWMAGARRKDTDADYGDVVSFVERFRTMLKDDTVVEDTPSTPPPPPPSEVFFVMNGDSIHGTGLSSDPPRAVVSILEQIPFDAVTVGEHEIAKTETVQYLTQIGGYVDFMGERYLTSNVVLDATNEPMGSRYTILQRDNATLLAFGFLYDDVDPHSISSLVRVEKIQEVVKSTWFSDALTGETYDAVLVLAHMGLNDPSIPIIQKAIRSKAGANVPVQFLAGHTHERDAKSLGAAARVVEAGKFFDTLGFASFPKKKRGGMLATNAVSFHHTFIETTTTMLASLVGLDDPADLPTTKGKALSAFIARTRNHLGLDEIVGCAPRTFELDAPIRSDASLVGLYKKEIVPTMFTNDKKPKVVIQRTDTAMSYSLYRGNLTMDDVLSSVPRNESFWLLAENVPGKVIQELNRTMNAGGSPLNAFLLIGVIDDDVEFDMYTVESDKEALDEHLMDLIPDQSNAPSPINLTVEDLVLRFVRETWPECTRTWKEEDLEEELENWDWIHTQRHKIKIAIGVSIGVALSVFFVVVFRLVRDRNAAALVGGRRQHGQPQQQSSLRGIDFGFDEDADLMLQNEEAKLA